jgi:hypothetical protein
VKLGLYIDNGSTRGQFKKFTDSREIAVGQKWTVVLNLIAHDFMTTVIDHRLNSRHRWQSGKVKNYRQRMFKKTLVGLYRNNRETKTLP